MLRVVRSVCGLICAAGALAAPGPAWARQSASPAAVIVGTVRDGTAAVLPGVTVTVRAEERRSVEVATTDRSGAFRVEGLAPGPYTVELSLPNFATRRITGLRLQAADQKRLDTTLVLTLTADVSVTAKRTFRNLAEEPGGGSLIGVADTASEGIITGRQLDARPITRTGEILEAVPGLVISQHSGEGKANQFYLRGFNLDHGTDFATSVAGVPVNMPTHAHGQGYSDLNFVIPELIGAIQFQKGLYAAEQGDFATAGASHVRYVNVLPAPLARISVGGDGWRRTMAAASPSVGGGHLLLAVESAHNDGPWIRPDDYGRVNAVVGYSRGDVRNGFSINAMAYRGAWAGTDQAPARAIAAGQISRYEGIDQTTGGETARTSLSADWQRTHGAGVTRGAAFAMRYRLNLFSNFTYFLDDPVNGDQFEQADRRWVSGGALTHRRHQTVLGRAAELSVGLDLRHDAIGEVGLHRTVARRRLFTVRDDAVDQAAVGSFVQHEVQWRSWLRSTLGLRTDRYWFDVRAGDPRNSGQTSAGLVSPKGNLVLGPWRRAELYLSAGTGFHSNDARGTTITVDPATDEPVDAVTPLVRARGFEIGLRTTPRPGVQATVAVWTLALDSELLFVGDAGTTDAGRPSRRSGVEVSALLAPRPWLTLDADVSLSRGRFSNDDPAGSRIPGALERVIAGGVTVHDRHRVSGSLRLRHFGPRDLVEDGSVRSHATTMVNGQLAVRASGRAQIVLDAFNLFDATVSDIDYFYTSRLAGEPASGLDDVHSHPALRRSVRVGLQVGF